MTQPSNHSQDYDRKRGVDHDVKDKAALKEAFIDKKRKSDFVDSKRTDAGRTDTDHVVRTPDEDQ